jgi:hypothetical protein
MTRFRALLTLGLVALLTNAAFASPQGEAAREAPRGFSRRSGATRDVLIVTSCGQRESEPKTGLSTALAAQIQSAKRLAIENRLRMLAAGGSSDWMSRGPRTKQEIEKLMKELRPKYQQMIKEYFEKLEKTQNDNK